MKKGIIKAFVCLLVLLPILHLFDTGVQAQAGYDLDFSTYVGGVADADQLRDIAVDSAGNIYVAGGSPSSNFPTSATAGNVVHDSTHNGNFDIIVQKRNRAGIVQWSTFLGGSTYERAYAIEVIGSGAAAGVYIGGRAGSAFPVTSGVVQDAFAGDSNPNPEYGDQDGFVAKFSLTGTLIYATWLGGPGRGIVRDIAVDSSGNVYAAIGQELTGVAHVANAPTSFDTTYNGGATDGVVIKINDDGTGLVYAGYLGGNGDDIGTPSIRVNSAGEAYVYGYGNSTSGIATAGAFDESFAAGTGGDSYLFKINAAGSAKLWGTYFGGTDSDFGDTHNLALDNQERPVIAFTCKSTGLATSGVFDTTHNGNGGSGNYTGDGIVAIFSTDGASLIAATYVGGSSGDGIEGIAIDASGIYISGATHSSDMPDTADADQATITSAGVLDGFVAKLSLDLVSLIHLTYVGGTGIDVLTGCAVWNQRHYAIGETAAADYDLANATQGTFAGGATDAVLSMWDNAACAATLPDGSSRTFAFTGGVHSIRVGIADDCQWTAASNDSSVASIASGASGTGTGYVVFNAAPNPNGSSLSTTIDINEAAFTITTPQIGTFVSPTGTAGGDGTRANPYDLQTALGLAVGSIVNKTIILLGGAYNNKYIFSLSGTSATDRIQVRPYPGHAAIVEGYVTTTTTTTLPDATTTTLTLTDATKFPVNSTFVFHDGSAAEGAEEQVRVATRTGNDLTLNRGWGGTTAVAHSSGATVVKSGNQFEILGDNVDYIGLILRNSDPIKEQPTPNAQNGPHFRGIGAFITGDKNRFIGIYAHDNEVGIFNGSGAIGNEMYGCVVILNGYRADTEYNGPGGYFLHSDTTNPLIVADSIWINNNKWGLKPDSQSGNSVNIDLLRNIVANNDSWRGDSTRIQNIIAGANNGIAADINIQGNFIYTPPGLNGGGVSMVTGQDNDAGSFVNNYVVGSVLANITRWSPFQMTGNTFYLRDNTGGGNDEMIIWWDHASPNPTVDNNSYFNNATGPGGGFKGYFKGASASLTFADWKTQTGFDANSTETTGVAPSDAVFPTYVRHTGNIHLAVYNYSLAASVNWNPVGFLTSGDRYEIYAVENYSGPAVASGIWTSGNISIPMNGTTVQQPIGWTGAAITTNRPEFGAFVLWNVTRNGRRPF